MVLVLLVKVQLLSDGISTTCSEGQYLVMVLVLLVVKDRYLVKEQVLSDGTSTTCSEGTGT